MHSANSPSSQLVKRAEMPQQKRLYEVPILSRMGAVADITQGNGSKTNDLLPGSGA